MRGELVGWAVLVGMGAAFGAAVTARAAEPAPAAAVTPVAAIALAVLAEEEAASGWQLVYTDPAAPPKFAYFGNASNLGRLGPYLQAWFRQERVEAKRYLTEGGEPFAALSAVQGWVFDCEASRSEVTDIVVYTEHGGKGESTASSHRDSGEFELSADAPDSAPAALRAWACANYKPPSKPPARSATAKDAPPH